MIEWIKIIGFSILSGIVYGVLHDQVTAHLAIEYFTIAHPPVFPTEDPILLALGWGIIATWWVGLALGLALACAARLGPMRKLALVELRGRIFGLLAIMAGAASLGGIVGAVAQLEGFGAIGNWADIIPSERQVRFAAAAWAHSASYLVGIVGGVAVCWRTFRERQAHASSSMSQ